MFLLFAFFQLANCGSEEETTLPAAMRSETKSTLAEMTADFVETTRAEMTTTLPEMTRAANMRDEESYLELRRRMYKKSAGFTLRLLKTTLDKNEMHD